MALVDQIGMNGALKKISYHSRFARAIDSFDDLCNELRRFDISRDNFMVPENVVALTDCDNASSSAPMVLECELKITKLIDQPSKLVGVKDAATRVTELLIRGSTSTRIISIVGMPGLGKTTLASHVYEDFSIRNHFIVRGWCCASQAYKKETLLFNLLTQFVDGEINPETSGDDLAERLCRTLKGRRYLIVIDDVWDTKVWQDLQGIFLNRHNGSRVLLTTQCLHVAPEANSLVYSLRLLSNQESCKLLHCKVFDSETCPPELSATSKQIARGCKGLPLAIVLVVGILRRAERSKESWDQVVAGVKVLQRGTGDHLHIERLRKILELSYKELPDALRPCFFSFAAFPDDTLISVSKLIRLWISQGFVRRENCNLEVIAKSYLTELIDRSLVMIARRSSSEGIKVCRVHDVLLDFCLAESKSRGKENLVLEEAMLSGILHLHHRLSLGGKIRTLIHILESKCSLQGQCSLKSSILLGKRILQFVALLLSNRSSTLS